MDALLGKKEISPDRRSPSGRKVLFKRLYAKYNPKEVWVVNSRLKEEEKMRARG
jgi:hypothetical protein